MKMLVIGLCIMLLSLACSACGDSNVQSHTPTSKTTAAPTTSAAQQSLEAVSKEESSMQEITITVGDRAFSAALCDNPAAKAFSEMLPMALDMSELNGNEKYYYLDSTLPTDQSNPNGINAGDIMLYGNSCIVLFYESFSTTYSYTPIGRINDPTGLSEALGSGSVQVSFAKN